MFYDKPGCKQYAEKVFKFENFLTEEEVKKINEVAFGLDKQAWVYENQEIDWYKDKTGPTMIELFPIWEKMSDLLYPDHVIHPMLSLLAVKPGDKGMFVHADSPGRDMEEELTQHDRWQTCCIIDYGIIVYMGDFEGGEVFYPNISKDGIPQEEDYDNCLEVPVKPGDLVIHGSCNPYEHGVREVTSGVRFAFTNFMLLANENPGTFFNYKTDDYNNQVGDKSLETLQEGWMIPLEWNPRFPKYINND